MMYDHLRDLVACIVDDMTSGVKERRQWLLDSVNTDPSMQSAEVVILVPCMGLHQSDGTKDPDGWARLVIQVVGTWVAAPRPGKRPI